MIQSLPTPRGEVENGCQIESRLRFPFTSKFSHETHSAAVVRAVETNSCYLRQGRVQKGDGWLGGLVRNGNSRGWGAGSHC